MSENKAYRIEHDSMGEMKVPADAYWGSQTQRSLENFRIGKEKMPEEIIRAFAVLKKGAASANCRLNKLDKEKDSSSARYRATVKWLCRIRGSFRTHPAHDQ